MTKEKKNDRIVANEDGVQEPAVVSQPLPQKADEIQISREIDIRHKGRFHPFLIVLILGIIFGVGAVITCFGLWYEIKLKYFS